MLLEAHAQELAKPKPPKMPKLERGLAVIDLETTDAQPETCAIFQFAVTVLMPDSSRKNWSQTFKPWKPITPEAEEITGTTNVMVAGMPPFSEYAEKILAGLAGKDLAGYNIRGFDAVALDQELRRCRLKLNLDGVRIIDCFGLFSNKEKRDLTTAVKKYCGRDHEGAHGAAADCAATADVLAAQLGAYPDLAEMSIDELAAFTRRGDKDYADIAQKLYRDSDGDLRYTLAKVRDVKVRDDVGFAMWMRRTDFPGSTIEVLDAELARIGAL
jgi:DNA polymerase-3 subunit epsilon